MPKHLLACTHAVISDRIRDARNTSFRGIFALLLGDLKSNLNPLSTSKIVDFSNLRRDTKISLLWSCTSMKVLINVSGRRVLLFEDSYFF